MILAGRKKSGMSSNSFQQAAAGIYLLKIDDIVGVKGGIGGCTKLYYFMSDICTDIFSRIGAMETKYSCDRNCLSATCIST